MDEITKETECCQNCKHFYQHYVENMFCKERFTPTVFGHCVYPRFKNRKCEDVCGKFERRERDEKGCGVF